MFVFQCCENSGAELVREEKITLQKPDLISQQGIRKYFKCLICGADITEDWSEGGLPVERKIYNVATS